MRRFQKNLNYAIEQSLKNQNGFKQFDKGDIETKLGVVNEVIDRTSLFHILRQSTINLFDYEAELIPFFDLLRIEEILFRRGFCCIYRHFQNGIGMNEYRVGECNITLQNTRTGEPHTITLLQDNFGTIEQVLLERGRDEFYIISSSKNILPQNLWSMMVLVNQYVDEIMSCKFSYYAGHQDIQMPHIMATKRKTNIAEFIRRAIMDKQRIVNIEQQELGERQQIFVTPPVNDYSGQMLTNQAQIVDDFFKWLGFVNIDRNSSTYQAEQVQRASQSAEQFKGFVHYKNRKRWVDEINRINPNIGLRIIDNREILIENPIQQMELFPNI